MDKIKFIYFDIGGVMNDWKNAFKTATKKFSIPLDQFQVLWNEVDDDITRGRITSQEMWKKAVKRFGLKNADDYNFVESWMGDYKPRKEVHELAKRLSTKYKIGLISNLYEGMYPRLIELGIVANLDYSAIVLSNETGLRKPEKEIYKLATKKAAIKPEEILLVDDRQDFVEGAKKFGWQGFWFNDKDVKGSVRKLEIMLD